MKIRIKGNSVRLRLSRTEVERFGETGVIEEHTDFPVSTLIYRLIRSGSGKELCASFDHNVITVLMPSAIANDWVINDIVGYDANMRVGNTGSLYILVEKDFQCLDETLEDQSDNYENPSKTC